MSAVSLATAKEFENKLTTASDTELQKFIDRAEAIISRRISAPLEPTEYTEKYDGGGASIVLRHAPVTEVATAAYADSTSIDVDDLDVDLDSGIVRWGYNTAGVFTAGTRFVTITYTAGFDPLPADLEEAVLEMVRHLWESQRSTGAGQADFPGASGEFVEPGRASYLLPYRVESLIAPYLPYAIA